MADGTAIGDRFALQHVGWMTETGVIAALHVYRGPNRYLMLNVEYEAHRLAFDIAALRRLHTVPGPRMLHVRANTAHADCGSTHGGCEALFEANRTWYVF